MRVQSTEATSREAAQESSPCLTGAAVTDAAERRFCAVRDAFAAAGREPVVTIIKIFI